MAYKTYRIFPRNEHGLCIGITVDMIGKAILDGDDLETRALVLEWLRHKPHFADVARPDVDDERVFRVTAAVIELLAERAGQEPPAWTADAPALSEPFFVMQITPPFTFNRDLCLEGSPEPLKRRNIFAPPNYLMMA